MTRTILIHLNVELPDDSELTPDQVVSTAIQAAWRPRGTHYAIEDQLAIPFHDEGARMTVARVEEITPGDTELIVRLGQIPEDEVLAISRDLNKRLGDTEVSRH